MRARQFLSSLLWLTLFAAPLAAQADPRYTVTVVAGLDSVANDINLSGQVVGYLDQGDSASRAFVFSNGVLTELPTSGVSSMAQGINDSGQVVGVVQNPSTFRGFLYSGGTMTDLPTLGGNYSFAAAINNAGIVAGFAQLGSSSDGLLPHAFTYSGGAMQDLGTLQNGNESRAQGINGAGHVVGYSTTSELDCCEHAFLYKDGMMIDIGPSGSTSSSASAINDADQVAGWAEAGADPDTGIVHVHAFLYSSGVMHDLGTLEGDFSSLARDVNNLGQAVGISTVLGGARAFLYENGKMIDLATLLDPALGWTLRNASAINDLQQIAATACNSLGGCYAVRLDPAMAVPEPASYAMLLAGAGLLGWLRRRSRTARRHATQAVLA